MALRSALLLAVLALFFISSVFSDEVDESDVLVLTKDNFEDAINDNEFVLVEFYAPWCGHCKKLIPEYAKAATLLKDEGVKLGKVDATVETELATSHGVRGYPTLKFFRSGSPTDYDGPRDAQGIKKWLLKKTGPAAVTLKTAEEITDFIAKEGSQVVGYFDTDSEEHKAFLQAAVQSEVSDFEFGQVLDGSDNKNKIHIHKDDVDEPIETDATADVEEIKTFILNKGFPLVTELGQPAFQRAQNVKRPIVAIFIEDNDEKKATQDLLNTVAPDFEGKVLFTKEVGGQYMKMAEQWGASGKKYPTAIFIDLRPDATGARPIAFDEEKEFNEESFKSFLQGCLEGTETGFLKSQEIPEDNDGPVKVVVAKTFEEIALDEERDVLVEFYAPWCGHCKKLAPIYDEVGEALKDEDRVVIAKMDATANALASGVDVRGYPTLLFWKKGSKESVSFDGDRTKEGILNWLKENGSFDDLIIAESEAAEGEEKDEL